MKEVKTTTDLKSVLKSKFQINLDENREELYRWVCKD